MRRGNRMTLQEIDIKIQVLQNEKQKLNRRMSKHKNWSINDRYNSSTGNAYIEINDEISRLKMKRNKIMQNGKEKKQ